MSKSHKPLRTHADAAKFLGVTTKSIAQWRDNFEDFPQRSAAGAYQRRELAAFCRRHSLGPFNPARSERSRGERTKLHESRRLLTIEKFEHTRVVNSRLRAEQQRELDGVVLASDVSKMGQQMRATVNRVHEEYQADLVRLTDQYEAGELDYAALRVGVLDLCSELPRRTLAAVKGVT